MSSVPSSIPNEFITELLADMERLGSRPYAEIGVPMFLVAENLGGGAAPKAEALNPMDSAELSAIFTQAAAALQTHRTELTASDIARLVEVIADRHFLGLSTPAFSQIGALHPILED